MTWHYRVNPREVDWLEIFEAREMGSLEEYGARAM